MSAVLNAEAMLDDLTYFSYAHNRRISPHVSPERWEQVYGDTTALEERFQREKVTDPYTHRPLTDEEIDRFQEERDEERAREREFRRIGR